jgi:hypothetical protein
MFSKHIHKHILTCYTANTTANTPSLIGVKEDSPLPQGASWVNMVIQSIQNDYI